MLRNLQSFQTFLKKFLSPVIFISAVMTLLITTGCASVDPQVAQTQTRGKTIAVASALGPSLELKWIGTTIFNSEEGTVPVPAWKMDDLVVNTVSSALYATQRYAAVTTFTHIGRVGDAVPLLPPGAHADYLLLIEPWVHGDSMFGSNESFQGVGVVQRSFMGLARTKAHISVRVTLFDMSTGKFMGVNNAFEHWDIPTRLKSGGSFNLKADKLPVPRIDERDLAELQQPITLRLVKIIEGIIGEMGLR